MEHNQELREKEKLDWCNCETQSSLIEKRKYFVTYRKAACVNQNTLYRHHGLIKVRDKTRKTCVYCYHNNMLPPLFFNLFLTNSQIHGYCIRTANNYRVHHCRTHLRKNWQLFTKVLRSGIPFLLQSLLCHVFQILKTARVFSKIITELAKPNTVALST